MSDQAEINEAIYDNNAKSLENEGPNFRDKLKDRPVLKAVIYILLSVATFVVCYGLGFAVGRIMKYLGI